MDQTERTYRNEHMYHVLDVVAVIVVVIGGLNWLIVGLFDYNLIANALVLAGLSRLVFTLVGIAAIYMLVRMPSLYHIGGKTHAPPQTPPSAV